MHFRTQIQNVTLVNEGRRFTGALVIDDDRIEEIIEGDAAPLTPVDEVIDGTGCYLLPGVIDDHVHFRDPGLTHKGDFASESRAAAAGGVTTVFDMPNCLPQTTTWQAFEDKWRIASQKSVVNYGFLFGATAGNAYELSKLNPRKVAGIKLFMGSSTGNMLVESEASLRAIFEEARLPIMVHCEDSRLIAANLDRLRAVCGDDPGVAHHAEVRSAEACYRSTSLAVKLARETGARLHVAHLSTARELELFDANDPQITAEACVGHLWFSDRDYERLGSRIKVNPAIKTEADRSALRAALRSGKLFTVGTDHAPHRLNEKVGGCVKAASGMPLVQFSLVAMLELTDQGVLTLEQLVQLMCHHPAQLFSIENRGYLREGYKADLVLVRPHCPWTLTPNRIQSLCNWSPLEGHTFNWRVERTFCNGFPIYNRGHVTDEKFRGQAVCYNR
ncbi:MAG: dihydroorotase [Bacteroidales bacterium]|nr:dihydroorotase [Bacteroidales bacterium]